MMRCFCVENIQAQALISSEKNCRRICGCVLFSPAECGVIVQIHIRNLPDSGFFGLQIESSDFCIKLPPLLSCGAEALMSIFVGGVSIRQLLGASVVVLNDPCGSCVIACGQIRLCGCRSRCTADPRPLFASPIRC